MEIIKQSHQIIGLVPTDPIGNMQRIELVGRCCYQSYDKQTDDSYFPFTMQMIDKGHLAMVEHSNLVICQSFENTDVNYISDFESLINSNFIKAHHEYDGNTIHVFFGGNYRAWMEQIKWFGNPTELFNNIHEWLDEFGFNVTEVTDLTEIPNELKRITVFFRTNRAVTHELVRHRPPSYGQLSQRYVRHRNMQFIQPVGLEMDSQFMEIFIENCKQVEKSYNLLLANYKPQQARNVLTNAVATDIFVTADIQEWKHIFKLRCARDADPQMQDIMNPVQQDFIDRGWI